MVRIKTVGDRGRTDISRVKITKVWVWAVGNTVRTCVIRVVSVEGRVKTVEGQVKTVGGRFRTVGGRVRTVGDRFRTDIFG